MRSRFLVVLPLLVVGSCASPRPEVEKFHTSAFVDRGDFPDAHAVVLLDRTELLFSFSPAKNRPYASEVRTRRIQILDEKGLEHAKALIPYDARSEVLHTDGKLLRANGDVVQMPPDKAVDLDRYTQSSAASSLYNGLGYKATKVSGAEVGDVVEITYQRVWRDPRWVDPIEVGGPLPCVRGEVIVIHPSVFDVDYRVTKHGKVVQMRPTKIPTRVGERGEDQESGVPGYREVFVFEREPALFPEELSPDASALSRQVHVQLRSYTIKSDRHAGFTSFDDVAGWYAELTAGKDTPDTGTASFARTWVGAKEKARKLYRVQRFVQDEVKDVPTFVQLASLQAHAPKAIIDAKIGDAKDQASLTLALLRQLDVDGFPVLVSRAGSFASVPDLPTPAAFNHVVVAVPTGGAYAYIDPSTPFLPTGRLPGPLQGQKGVLVRPGGQAEIIDLPEDPPEQNTRALEYDLVLSADGMCRGQLKATLVGLGAAAARTILAEGGPDVAAKMRALLLPGSDDAGMEFESVVRVAAKSDDPDQPLKLQIPLLPKKVATPAGDRLDLLPEAMLGKPFAFLWREARKAPVVFDHKLIESVKATLALPPSMGLLEPPAEVKRASAYFTVDERWAVADGALWTSRTLRLDERVVPPESYDDMREPVRALWARQESPIKIGAGGERGASYAGDPF